ncbi:MAG: GNAT family N-acetyltransferase [Candidatus Omnitrophica bacterium]|nr:GNAT family N-acetyltransferase [Candidatus Omnitrophota bacterium]
MNLDIIDVRKYNTDQAGAVRDFLQASNNGTLFHELDFLAYHSPERFNAHHLVFSKEGKMISFLPAAIVKGSDGRDFLRSPYGASVGGPVLPCRIKTAAVINMLTRLQEYVSSQGLAGIDMRLGPSVYMREPDDVLDFSLFATGFRLSKTWLLHIIPLESSGDELFVTLFSKTKRNIVRSGLKKGLQPREAGVEGLDVFYDMLSETQARHNASVTHTRQELKDLFERVPGRLRLFLCSHEGIEIAGILVLMLNGSVAYTFYICGSYEHKKLDGPAILIAHIIECMAREGVRYLDLGPSSFDDLSLNHGVAFFKEEIGGRGFCRNAWQWACSG